MNGKKKRRIKINGRSGMKKGRGTRLHSKRKPALMVTQNLTHLRRKIKMLTGR